MRKAEFDRASTGQVQPQKSQHRASRRERGSEAVGRAFGSYPDAAGMAQHFASAGLWFALGGCTLGGRGACQAAAVEVAELPAASGGSAGPAANSPNVNSQQPTQVVNVTHLASGGLVNRPTLAVVGDSAGGGSGREAILPLDNATAMRHIGAAIAAAMKGSGGGAPVEIHFHGGIGELVSRMNRGTQDGTIRVYASHAKNGTALSK
jgi:hypothetical protein